MSIKCHFAKIMSKTLLRESFDRFDALQKNAIASLQTFSDVVLRPESDISVSAIELEAEAFVVELSWHDSFHKYVVQLAKILEDIQLLHDTILSHSPALSSSNASDKKGAFMHLKGWFKSIAASESQESVVRSDVDLFDFDDNFYRCLSEFNKLKEACETFLRERLSVLCKCEFLIKERVVKLSRQDKELIPCSDDDQLVLVQYMEEVASAIKAHRSNLALFKQRLIDIDYNNINQSSLFP